MNSSPESNLVSFPAADAQPARTLARGRKTQNWLAIFLVVSGLFNIAVLAFACVMLVIRQKVIVLDLASGDLVVAPIVDPASSPEILRQMVTWCSQSVADRSPAGLDDDELVTILFERPAAKQVRDEFEKVKQQYKDKEIRSKIEIANWTVQPIGEGHLMATVTGQVIIDGVVNGVASRDVEPVTLKFDLVHNPDLGRNLRYPLMCHSFSGIEAIDAQIEAPPIK